MSLFLGLSESLNLHHNTTITNTMCRYSSYMRTNHICPHVTRTHTVLLLPIALVEQGCVKYYSYYSIALIEREND